MPPTSFAPHTAAWLLDALQEAAVHIARA